ncbi:hypothetical protein [Sulfurospirillum sp.]|uniref:hypothetical protein n=1 Tax=Sulfurospirillum sp. TaxID=2053622 RepID=UPI002FDD9B64
MHVQKSGTFYDVYVKNDTYYQKMLDMCNEKNTTIDTSFNDYMNEIQTNISELSNVSVGDIHINILPESANDKSSSSTADVSDDIIGMSTSKYYYEADETISLGVTTSENMIFNITPDKTSVHSVIDKLQATYKDDTKLSATLNRYSNPETFVDDFLTLGVDENGEKIYTLSAIENPLAYAIANLNTELTGESLGDIMDGKCFFGAESIKKMLEELAEEKKRENEKALLKTTNSSNDGLEVS